MKKRGILSPLDLENCTGETDCRVLTMQEAAAKLQISIPTMYKLTKEPDFPAFRVGRGLRVREDMLTAWMNAKSGGQ